MKVGSRGDGCWVGEGGWGIDEMLGRVGTVTGHVS